MRVGGMHQATVTQRGVHQLIRSAIEIAENDDITLVVDQFPQIGQLSVLSTLTQCQMDAHDHQ